MRIVSCMADIAATTVLSKPQMGTCYMSYLNSAVFLAESSPHLLLLMLVFILHPYHATLSPLSQTLNIVHIGPQTNLFLVLTTAKHTHQLVY